MASELEATKKSIVASDDSDPDLDEAFKKALDKRFELYRESNRHEEKKVRISLGLFGVLLGSKESAPTNVAFGAVVLSFAAFFACLWAAKDVADQTGQEFWSRHAERALSLAAAALAYIFGRSSSKS